MRNIHVQAGRLLRGSDIRSECTLIVVGGFFTGAAGAVTAFELFSFVLSLLLLLFVISNFKLLKFLFNTYFEYWKTMF